MRRTVQRYLNKYSALWSTIKSEASPARQATGKPVVSQLFEIARLRYGAGQLQADEYYPVSYTHLRAHET